MVYLHTKKSKFWSILEGLGIQLFGILCGNWVYFWVYFMATKFNLLLFGLFFPILVRCTEKNLATLVPGTHSLVVEIFLGIRRRPLGAQVFLLAVVALVRKVSVVERRAVAASVARGGWRLWHHLAAHSLSIFLRVPDKSFVHFPIFFRQNSAFSAHFGRGSKN
jgi:hypothetical protein